ncbi:ABC transporter ATP-binding protein [Haloferax gibbonsii]|uniref:ABC-type D-xylose/L-arabinose transporter n=1 Tax=Haloferax gibbonsii TaxID=35746 RepID=A0A0K1IZ84_HALGI|nr:ABC transporter ATP-binding protein [Haloferax gibbonsii]AKU09832.1 sugar ABC transporter ATP-binding protein [Haloferax gibbonsii]
MADLTIKNLEKQFDGILAVDDVSIDIADGEFLVIVGPSGCGKSTTLNCVAGLQHPTDGKILLDGEDITTFSPQERDIAMVFQNYALYPHMTVRENLSFGLKMSSDLPKSAIREKAEEIAELLSITDLLDDKPKQLSGGQQQRVALGRAIIREPEAFLMDEPLSNLDAKLRTEMRTELQKLQNDLDTTTIYVTHDQTEAMTMGDKIAVLNGGKLQQLDSPLELYYRPANQFVASFIGNPSMNFLDVTKAMTANGVELRHDQFTFQFADTPAELESSNDSLVLGVRPEKLEIADGTERNTIDATVNVIEPMGDVNHAYVQVGDVELTVTLPGTVYVPEGEDVTLALAESDIHVFDREVGNSLVNPTISTEDLPIENGAQAATGAEPHSTTH